MQLFIVIILF